MLFTDKDKYFVKYYTDVNVNLFTDEDKYFAKYYNDVMSICLLKKINSLLNNIMMLMSISLL